MTRRMTLALGLALAVSQSALAEDAADRAVAAAQQYSGTTLSLHTEAGLQALGWELYNAKKWEELTGIKIEITSAPVNEMFVTTVQDFRGPANYDVLDVAPAYLPDLVEMGAIVPVDDWMDQYGYRDEYADIAEAYKGWGEYKGNVYGFPDDGDVHIMLYRKDLLEENEENQKEFMEKHGYELGAPKTWDEWDDVAQFITDKYGPDMYGAAQPRAKGLTLYFWMDMFRDYGGRFFDEETMDCTWNSEQGVASLEAFVDQRRYMPPGVDAWGFTEAGASFLAGERRRQERQPGGGLPLRPVVELDAREPRQDQPRLLDSRSLPGVALLRRGLPPVVVERGPVPRRAEGRRRDRRAGSHRHSGPEVP